MTWHLFVMMEFMDNHITSSNHDALITLKSHFISQKVGESMNFSLIFIRNTQQQRLKAKQNKKKSEKMTGRKNCLLLRTDSWDHLATHNESNLLYDTWISCSEKLKNQKKVRIIYKMKPDSVIIFLMVIQCRPIQFMTNCTDYLSLGGNKIQFQSQNDAYTSQTDCRVSIWLGAAKIWWHFVSHLQSVINNLWFARADTALFFFILGSIYLQL